MDGVELGLRLVLSGAVVLAVIVSANENGKDLVKDRICAEEAKTGKMRWCVLEGNKFVFKKEDK